MSGNGREPIYAFPKANGELNRVELKKDPSLAKKDLLQKPKEKRPIKPDYYDFDGDEVPYIDWEESYITREGIEDRQSKPPTSKLLISVMKYNPERPREVLWESFKRREQAPREVVVHPVKDLEYYKLRNCITCVQREKKLKAEREADPYAPFLQEFLVDDLVDGLTRLAGKVKSLHQEHMCVDSFLNMYLNDNFGNVLYSQYDIAKTQEELRKFSRLLNCHAETMKCLEMFCTRDQLDGFWRNAGLTSIYEISRNEISGALKKKMAKDAALTKDAAHTKRAAAAAPYALDAAAAYYYLDSDDFNSTEDEGADDSNDSEDTNNDDAYKRLD